MDTSINMQKTAVNILPIGIATAKAAGGVSKAMLTASLLAGSSVGLLAAGIANAAKTKPDKLRIAEEERKFYDARVKELANENWLNDVMTLRKKLDSKNLSNEERKATEKAYLDLIESNISE
jgi:flavin-dependent dehydrogenase